MKVLHISTSDRGGAANAALRLHKALLQEGIDSSFLVLKKFGNSEKTHTFRESFLLNRYHNFWNRLLKETKFNYEQSQLKGQAKGFENYSFADSWFDIRKSKLFQEADIINLHWVAGFLDYRTFFEGHSKKIVWTLHDMNPFTAGCHYSANCQEYLSACQSCPQLAGVKKTDLAPSFFKIKEKGLKKANLTIVSPSNWLSNLAKASSLFRKFPTFCIPNGLDLELFKQSPKAEARKILNLPQDKKIVFFTAQDTTNIRKGFQILYDALPILSDKNIVIYTAGKKAGFSFPTIEIIEAGTINSPQKMALAYSAADLFVIPSLEDNLPNTVLESLACGTPVVGFTIGGIPDMIQNGENGVLVDEISTEKLAKALKHTLANLAQFDSQKIRENCQNKYTTKIQAQNYMNLYTKIIDKNSYV